MIDNLTLTYYLDEALIPAVIKKLGELPYTEVVDFIDDLEEEHLAAVERAKQVTPLKKKPKAIEGQQLLK